MVVVVAWFATSALAQGQADVNEALIAAARSSNLQQVERLLGNGADPNTKDDKGATPLIWAAVSGSREIAEVLLDRGANVNAVDREGFTALHAAAYQLQPDVAELLIRRGAEVNATSAVGFTPLHKALERLATSGPVTGEAPASLVTGTTSVVGLLLANGADPNIRLSGETPLNFAVGTGQKVVVDLLVNKGADVRAANQEGVTPIYVAAKTGRSDIAAFLMDHGADPNAQTRSGFTPLIWAAQQGDLDFAQVLIARGAPLNTKDVRGRTALYYTLWVGTIASAPSPTARAIFERMTTDSTTPEQRQAFQTELTKAKGQWTGVAKLLLDHGAIPSNDAEGYSPLYVATYLGNAAVVAALIKQGADINNSKFGETALHSAIAERHPDIAQLLIMNGADVNAKNRSSRTPLHFVARIVPDAKLAELLIARGADINAKDNNGETPVAAAIRVGNMQVAEVLRRHGAI